MALFALCMAALMFLTLSSTARALPRELAEAVKHRKSIFDGISFLPHEPPAETSDASDAPESAESSEIEPSADEISAPDDDLLGVRPVNLCWYGVGETPSLFTTNYSGYDINLGKYSGKPLPFSASDISSPTVLIIHTHGSESYLPAGVSSYSEDETWRSTDPERGVVSVGRELARVLRENGIGVIHDETMHDVEGFNTSYSRSKKAVQSYLRQYPTIACVIDLHRDSVFTSDGENQKPVFSYGGDSAAQVMLVVGTDASGVSHPMWQKNLTFAVRLQEIMNDRYPMLARPVSIRKAAFNQQLCTGMLILEVGSCGNTVTEARTAAKLFGRCLADCLGA